MAQTLAAGRRFGLSLKTNPKPTLARSQFNALPTAQCSTGTRQSRRHPARPGKVMESAGQCTKKGAPGERPIVNQIPGTPGNPLPLMSAWRNGDAPIDCTGTWGAIRVNPNQLRNGLGTTADASLSIAGSNPAALTLI